jgi:hypothetical protein
MLKEAIETAKIGRALRVIEKTLAGVTIAGAISQGNLFCTYGNGDTANSGICLDAAVRLNGETGRIEAITIKEHLAAAGTLQKAALRIHFLKEWTQIAASGQAYVLSTDHLQYVGHADIAEADWKDMDAYNAVAQVKPGLDILTGEDTVLLKAIIEMRSTTKTYTANHSHVMNIKIAQD